MRGVIIFTLLFYSVTGFVMSQIPNESDESNTNTSFISEEQVLGLQSNSLENPGFFDNLLEVGNQVLSSFNTVGLLLTFQVTSVPFIINLLFLLPANIVIAMIAVQVVRGRL